MYKYFMLPLFVVLLSGCVGSPQYNLNKTINLSIDQNLPLDKTNWKVVDGADLPSEKAEWTFIMYFNGDNNLEDALYSYIEEMEQVGSDQNINIVMQTDTVNPFWELGSTTKRIYITKDSDPNIINPEILYDLGEQNMGNPYLLSDFIEWSVEKFPAKKYALVLWNHGGAWRTTSADETNDDLLELPELTEALKTAKEKTGVEFDIIGFDMCLLGTIDVDYAVAPYGKIRVGSADSEYVPAWDYGSIFSFVKGNPGASGEDVANKVIETYIPYNRLQGTDYSLILSAIDLKEVNRIKAELKDLVDILNKDIESTWRLLGKARFSSDKYSVTNPEGLLDLHSFLLALKHFTNNTEILEAANKTLEAIEDATMFKTSGKQHAESFGLSFVFQNDYSYYSLTADEYYQKSEFAKETGLMDLWDNYHEQQKAYTAPLSVVIMQDKYIVNRENPIVYIPTNFYGNDIVHRYMYVTEDKGDYYDILFISDLVAPGTSKYEIKDYKEGSNIEDVQWDGRVRGISNNEKELYAFSQPYDVVNDLFFSSGLFTSAIYGSFDADIIFDVGDNGKMTNVIAYDSLSGESLPFIPRVEPDDTFTFYGVKLTKNRQQTELYKKGEAIRFGEDGLRRTLVQVPDGEYTIFLTVEDITGYIVSDSVVVTVDLT